MTIETARGSRVRAVGCGVFPLAPKRQAFANLSAAYKDQIGHCAVSSTVAQDIYKSGKQWKETCGGLM